MACHEEDGPAQPVAGRCAPTPHYHPDVVCWQSDVDDVRRHSRRAQKEGAGSDRVNVWTCAGFKGFEGFVAFVAIRPVPLRVPPHAGRAWWRVRVASPAVR